MKIAVIGAGFAGLAVAWNLARQGVKKIVLFDKKGIGGGASGIAAGLLHAYGGPRARLNILGQEGLKASLALIHEASRFLSKPAAKQTGLYRIPTGSEQEKDFRQSLERDLHYDLSFKEFHGFSALYVSPAWLVDCPAYLEGLGQACASLGVEFEIDDIQSTEYLAAFDCIVIAAGAASGHFTECRALPLRALKGQILEYALPDLETHCLPFPVTVDSYLVPQLDKRTCIVGATFERVFVDEKPYPEQVVSLLLPNISAYFPFVADYQLLDCRAALRATTPDHQPWCKQLSSRLWLVTGLGSKGLLYHALLGQKATHQILKSIR